MIYINHFYNYGYILYDLSVS